MVGAVEGADDLSLGSTAHHDLTAAYLAGIEGVEGLSKLEEYEVADIDYVVDGAQPYAEELLLEPLG